MGDVLHHLWFVCTLPDDHGRFVTFNLSSFDSCVDPTCLIVPGEHRFVRHDSLIHYQLGRLRDVEKIELAVAKGLFSFDDRASPTSGSWASDALIARIRAGALRSEFTRGDVRKAIENCPWTFSA